HGVLSDHRVWRYAAGDLGRNYDLWLVDMPGCGDSDKPDGSLLGIGGYCPTALADRLLQSLDDSLKARANAPRLTVVAHSLGGMVALRAFADPELSRRHQSVLKQIDGMVLISPSDVIINQEIPTFTQVLALNGV